MFTQKDFNSIDRSYFKVIHTGCYGLTLQSKNTKHCWYIENQDLGNYESCKIYHTHHEGTPMHEHGHGRTLHSCIRRIKSHDEYQLKKDAKKRRYAKERRRNAQTGAQCLAATF